MRNIPTKIIYFLIILFFIIAISCSNSSKGGTKKANFPSKKLPYNITVLIDLSDRDLSNNQPKKTTDIPVYHDTIAIRTLLNSLMSTFKSLTIKDKFTIERVHQDNENYNDFFNGNYEKMKIDMEDIFSELKQQGKSALSIPKRKHEFCKHSNELISTVSILENLALKNLDPSGGDITKFLNEKLSYYYKEDYNNVLVILTDGDESFNKEIEENRKELNASGNYPELKVLMLGINAPNSSKNTELVSEICNTWKYKFKPIGINDDNIEFNEFKEINLIESKTAKFIK